MAPPGLRAARAFSAAFAASAFSFSAALRRRLYSLRRAERARQARRASAFQRAAHLLVALALCRTRLLLSFSPGNSGYSLPASASAASGAMALDSARRAGNSEETKNATKNSTHARRLAAMQRLFRRNGTAEPSGASFETAPLGEAPAGSEVEPPAATAAPAAQAAQAAAAATPPTHFCCPISMDLMSDPVVVATGTFPPTRDERVLDVLLAAPHTPAPPGPLLRCCRVVQRARRARLQSLTAPFVWYSADRPQL